MCQYNIHKNKDLCLIVEIPGEPFKYTIGAFGL